MRASLFLFGLFLLISVRSSEGVVLSPTASAPGLRTYENARFVAIDERARTITVRGGAVGKETTFGVDPQALQRSAMLKPGDQVVLTVRKTEVAGTEVVTQVERSQGTSRVRDRRRLAPPIADASPAPAPAARADAASPAPTPPPSPVPSRPGWDTVGPFGDPRVAPLGDPRQDPLRDPRVIPGLSEPAPIPSPTPPPS